LRSVANSQGRFPSGLSSLPLVGHNLCLSAVEDFPFGPALVTLFTNGIASNAKYVVVENGHQ
jgi:hypothetical protein